MDLEGFFGRASMVSKEPKTNADRVFDFCERFLLSGGSLCHGLSAQWKFTVVKALSQRIVFDLDTRQVTEKKGSEGTKTVDLSTIATTTV